MAASMKIMMAILAFAFAWPRVAIAESISPDSCQAILSGRVLDPVEGVWQFPADGARLLLTRSSATTFGVYLLASPMLGAEPGILIGSATAIPGGRTYDCRLQAQALGNKRIKNTTVLLELSSDGSALKFKPYNPKAKATLRAWLSLYFVRLGITQANDPVDASAQKVYPAAPSAYKPCL